MKDLVDILLIARASAVDGTMLSKAIQVTFDARGTHALPQSLPDAPTSWVAPFLKMAKDVGLRGITLSTAADMARGFLNPVLQGEAQGTWDPVAWEWCQARMRKRRSPI